MEFELDLPYGAKVVALFGAYDQQLISLAAFYDWKRLYDNVSG